MSDDVATPSIRAPNHAIIGTSLVLNCSVPYENGIPMDLQWTVPDQSGQDVRTSTILLSHNSKGNLLLTFLKWSEFQSGRIVVGKLTEVKETTNGEQSYAMLSVTVKQVKKSDEGSYICTVKDNANNQKVEKRYIPVLGKTKYSTCQFL